MPKTLNNASMMPPYPEFFTYYPEHFRDINICKVKTSVKKKPCAYARYAGQRAMLIIPNAAEQPHEITVTLPFDEAGLADNKAYTVTDAETGAVILHGLDRRSSSFTVTVLPQYQRVLLAEPLL